MFIYTEKKIKNYVMKFVSYEAFQTNLKELCRKFGLIKRVFGRLKRVLLIHSQMEEFRARQIWVQYVGGLINHGLNKQRLLHL